MSALKRELEKVWSQLRSQNPSRANAVTEIGLRGLRGIAQLSVPLPFPVSVLAGPNGCGKSTVLFALACAYRVPGAKLREFTPASLFPNFAPGSERETHDPFGSAELEFIYRSSNEHLQMRWARRKSGWHRSFYGRKSGAQPTRMMYLRTLANLSNPAEVRSVLQLAHKEFETESIDASNIAFAQRILAFRYDKLSKITSGTRNLLFARRTVPHTQAPLEAADTPRYSEFHMSAGERAILRLSMSISKLDDALVLIDEVEAGLHPQVQSILMLELQRLALRSQLQVVVTTHSPAVLETVPPEARVFLERTANNVVRREPYRDVVQKALYGQSLDTLSILCEDEEAEAFIRGLLDHLGPHIDLLQNDLMVGRDTGKDEFQGHVETLGRFRKLKDFVFVLDGDGRHLGPRLESLATNQGQALQVLYLPGDGPPELWVWTTLRKHAEDYASFFGLDADRLIAHMDQQEQLYEAATGKPTEIAKNRLYSLAESASHTVPALIREMAKTEARHQRGEIKDIVDQLHDAIAVWRADD